jgi:ABC-type uncharacterized transport system auxiliary subunit
MMKKAIALACLAAAAAACFAPSQAKRYFQLEPKTEAALTPLFDRALFVDRVEVADLYDDFRIVYRLSTHEINYYSYDFWAEKPSRGLREAIFHYLTGRGLFRRIGAEAIPGEADWTLRVKVHRIEETDAAEDWRGRLAMDLSVLETKTDRVLAFRSFDRSLPLGGKNVALLPVILARILAEELEALLDGLK